MKTYKIIIREFTDKKPNERYSITIDGLTQGWYSISGILKIINSKLRKELGGEGK